MLNSLGMGFMFTARDLASGTINHVTRSFLGMDSAALRANASYQRNFAVMGAGLGIMGAGAAVLGGAFALASSAGDFEYALARVGAVAQADAEDLAALRAEALRVGMSTTFAPEAALEGLEALASAGFNATESIRLMGSVASLAQGGSIAIGAAAETMAATMHVFASSIEEPSDAADQLLAISNMTALRASDLSLAIGSVARGAGSADQSLTEMLISMGLVRDTGVEASVAAQSVSSALLYMARQRDDFHALGVELTDASGEFRPFLDIVMETRGALEGRYTNAADRAAAATELFSRFGLQAYNAIGTRLTDGVRDAAGAMYYGADAVEFLRSEMERAAREDAAADFERRMLDTFEGQRSLLGGAASTLGILIGESFIAGIRPIVEGVLGAVRGVIRFINGIPAPVRTAMARFAIGVGVATFALGAFITATAMLALVTPFLGAIASAAGGLLLAMAPFLGAAAAVTALGVAIRELYLGDIGGFATWIDGVFGGIRLGFEGLVQLFTDGAFSGAVMEEMGEAGNSGIRQFVIDVFRIGFRLVSFFRGIGVGFSTALEAAAPAITAMTGAFTRLGQALGFLGSEGAGAVAGMPSEDFMASGARIGVVLGRAFEFIANAVSVLVDFTTDAVHGFQDFFSKGGIGVSLLMPAIESLGASFALLMDSVGATSGGTMSFGELLGGFVAASIDLVALGITGIVYGLQGMIMGVQMAITVWGMLSVAMTNMRTVFAGLALAIIEGFRAMALGVIVSLGQIAEAIPEQFRPGFVTDMVVRGRAAAGEALNAASNSRTGLDTAIAASRATITAPATAIAESATGREVTTSAALDRVGAAVERAAKDRGAFNISVQVDGETIATAVGSGDASRRAGAFEATGEPVPS